MSHQSCPCRTLLALALFCGAGMGSANAGPIFVTVDTATLAGTMGSLEFQFNPGSGALSATATLTSFTPAANLLTGPGNIQTSGGAAGDLSTTVTIDNSNSVLNDFIQDFNYPNRFSFTLTFSGPALSPTPPPPSGSTFSLTLWDGRGGSGSQKFVVDPGSGAALLIDVNPDGSPSATSGPHVTAVPEPASVILLLLGIIGLPLRRNEYNPKAAGHSLGNAIAGECRRTP